MRDVDRDLLLDCERFYLWFAIGCVALGSGIGFLILDVFYLIHVSIGG